MTERTPTRSIGRAAARAREAILELIDSGVFPPASKLPGERELAEQISVSRVVLREALSALAAEGRLESSPWRGWFVTTVHMAEQVTLKSFSTIARERGLRPGGTVVRSEVRVATRAEAAQLRLAPGARVRELHRLRTLDDQPACYDVSVLPIDRVPGIEDADLEDASLYRVLEDAGVRIVRSHYTVRAEAAAADVAQLLGIATDAPVLVGEELSSDLAGTPVNLGRVTYRSDAYEFHATLFRPFEPTVSDSV